MSGLLNIFNVRKSAKRTVYRIHIMDGVLPPEEIRIQELVARISALLGRQSVRTRKSIAASLGKNNMEKTTYQLIGSMVYPDSSFIGREQELDKI